MPINKLIQVAIDKLTSFIRPVNVIVNDPLVPIATRLEIPDLPNPCPPFTVQGFLGMDGPDNSLQHQATMVYTFIVHGIKSVGERLNVPLNRWARTNSLVVIPRAGSQFNAYYDGSSLRFFYSTNRNGKMVFTCESSDVVSHELGHAILDIIRPDLWGTQSIEAVAFHESFGDMVSIIAALCHDEVIDYVLLETNNDLRKSNIVSRVAEELGDAIYGVPALRNAVNDFKYVSPEKLPSNAPPDLLAREPHSFSRVFTGAFYDALVLQYEKNVTTDIDHKEALKKARDQIGSVLFNGVTHAANIAKFFGSVARAMQVTDLDQGGACADSLKMAFSNRGVLEVTPVFSGAAIAMDISHVLTHKYRGGFTMRAGGTKKVKLSNEMILSQSHNPLYGVDIDIPNDHYLEYDVSGKCKAEIPVNKAATLASAKMCLDYLNDSDKVSYNSDNPSHKEFTVLDGKLVRNYICCCHG